MSQEQSSAVNQLLERCQKILSLAIAIVALIAGGALWGARLEWGQSEIKQKQDKSEKDIKELDTQQRAIDRALI